MTVTPLTVAEERPRTLPEEGRRRADTASVPALDPRPGSLAQRFAQALPEWHPAAVFLVAAVIGFALLAALSVAFGLLLTDVVLRIHPVAVNDERFVNWLVGDRTSPRTEGSLMGSIVAGGVVIPAVVCVSVAVLASCAGGAQPRSSSPRSSSRSRPTALTTCFVHRDRPSVGRGSRACRSTASYPSGHTAASIAVYCGLALLLTSRIRSTWFRVACWTVALADPAVRGGRADVPRDAPSARTPPPAG